MLVESDANDWSERMQTGGQVKCNFAVAQDALRRRSMLTICAAISLISYLALT
jgi:hypothetical protein